MKHLLVLASLLLACAPEETGVWLNGKKIGEAPPARAQEKAGTRHEPAAPRVVELSPAYGESHGKKIFLNAHLEIPGDKSVRVVEGPDAAPHWLQIDHRDMAAKAVREQLFVTPVSGVVVPHEQRMQTLEEDLVARAWPYFTHADPNAVLGQTRRLTVDGNPAVMIRGTFTEPSGAEIFIGLVGVLLPDDVAGILLVGKSDRSIGPVKSVAEIGTVGALFEMLETLKLSKLE